MEFLQWKTGSLGALLIYHFDSYLCPDQNVPAQPHLGKAALTGGIKELVMTNMGLLVAEIVCSKCQKP